MPKFASNFLHYGLLAVLATPLIFGTHLLFPFIVYRTYFFYFLVDALFVLFLYQYGMTWLARFRRERIMQMVGIFFGIKVITDLLGVHPWVSIWGNYERMMGLLTWLHLLLFLVMLVTAFGSRVEYRKVEQGMILVSALVSLYGLLQHWHIAFAIRSVDDRLFSTIGNPGFLAGFLLLAIGFCLHLIVHEQRYRWLYYMALLLDGTALYLTATRGAILGLFIGGFLCLIFVYVRVPPQWREYRARVRWIIGLSLAIFLFITVSLVVFRGSGVIGKSVTLRRLGEISLSEANVRSRIFLWSTAFRIWKNQPLLGAGENNLAGLIDRAYDPRIVGQWFDSTHNQFLDVLLAHGLLGFIAYVALLSAVGHSFFRDRQVDPLGASIHLAALVAYIFYSLFLFDTLVVALPIIVIFGAAVVRSDYPAAQKSPAPARLYASVAGLIVLALFFAYIRGIQSLLFASQAFRGIENRIDLTTVITEFSQASRLAYFGYGNLASIFRDASIKIIHNSGQKSTAQLEQLLAMMADAHRLAREKEGMNSQWLADPGKVYLEMASSTNPYLDTALSLFDQAIAFSPRRIDLWYAKAQVYLQKHDRMAAEAVLTQAEQVFPYSTAEIEFRLAEIAAANGTADEVFAHIERYAKQGKVVSVADYDHFTQLFIVRRDWRDALLVIERELLLEPNNPKFLANLAQVYKQLGDRVKARAAATHLQTLYPGMTAQVQSFIDSL